MPFKNRANAIARAREISAMLDAESGATPKRRYSLACELDRVTLSKTPNGRRAHPWTWGNDAIEKERAELNRKATRVINETSAIVTRERQAEREAAGGRPAGE